MLPSLAAPRWDLRARTKGNWQGGAFFHRPVPKYVKSPPPFPLSLWTPLPRLPSVRPSVCLRTSLPSGCVSAPNRLPPIGVRSTPSPWSVRLSQALPAFLRFVFLFLSPHPQPLLFSLSLDSPFFSLCGPLLHILSVSLRNTQADHPYLSLTLSYSPLLHRFFPTSGSSSFSVCLSISEDALSPSPHRSSLFWVGFYLA